MISVHGVAAYIIASRGPMTTMKLQKLLYYVQAWAMVWDNEPIFREHIQAWNEGPVVRETYDEHRGLSVVSEYPLGDVATLSSRHKAVIDAVLDSYGNKNGSALSRLSHSEAPWRNARVGLAPTERGTAQIKPDAMRAFYSSDLFSGPRLVEPDTDKSLKVEFEQEGDGRWIADVPDLPGVLVYGKTRTEAWLNVRALAKRVIEDQVKHGEAPASMLRATFVIA